MSIVRQIRENRQQLTNLEYQKKLGSDNAVDDGFIVKNTSGSTIARYSVVELIDGIINSSTNRGQWADIKPAINVRLPQTGAVRLAIMLDSVPAGKIGRASIDGILKANVNVSSTSHEYATFSDGSGVLISATEGEFLLSICSSGTGEQLAYVSFAAGSGGASPAAVQEYVEIIEGLEYATAAEQLGRGQYLCRLTSDNTEEWVLNEEEDYPLNQYVIGSDNKRYQCTTSEGSGTQDPVTDTENDNWTLTPDDTVVRIWDKGTDTTDMRHYIPWLVPEKIYPVRKFKFDGENDEYVFELTFTHIGAPGQSNFVVDEDTQQVKVAVGDMYSGT